jgi:hypothetical protein
MKCDLKRSNDQGRYPQHIKYCSKHNIKNVLETDLRKNGGKSVLPVKTASSEPASSFVGVDYDFF